MGASPLMSIGIRTMTANYAAMQAVSHNIANANVAGYSRQQAEFATSQGQFTGAGFFGKGVTVQTVTRSYSAFMAREAAVAKSIASMDTARLNQLRQLEDVFKPGEQGIGHATSQFLNAMVDLASRPADSAGRQVVLARAEELASRFVDASRQIEALQRGVTSELNAAVVTINELARNIAQANQKIAYSTGLGQPANDVLDERDRLLSRLSEQMQVSTVPADDGTIAVFVAGGQRLVLANQAAQLSLMRDPTDSTRSAVGFMDGTTPRPINESMLGGGAVAGLLRFQNSDLVDGRNLIGQLAVAVGGAVNEQQMLGLNLRQPAGQVASGALFQLGAPMAMPSSGNARDGSGNLVGSVQMRITAPSEVRAIDYELRMDSANGPGAFLLIPKSGSDRTPIAGVSGQAVAGTGLTIDIGDGFGGAVPPDTDRFLMQPVARAAGAMRRLLDNPADLAAASPLTAAATAVAGSSIGVASLRMVTPSQFPADSIRIEFSADPDTTDQIRPYSWERRDSGGNVLDSGTGEWKPGETIPTAPTPDLNGFALELSGVPREGDVVTVDPAVGAYLGTNNGNALVLASLRDALLVGSVRQADGRFVGGVTVTDGYAAALADIGVRVQGASASSDISAAMARQTEIARSSESGVNLDEEAARLIQFQQSYQAAAKILQIAQSVFATLLETAGG